MPRKLQTANARARHRRETLAIRRVGLGKKCACGESRPEAIIPGSRPTTCAKCDRGRHRYSELDKHHVFGKANSPLIVSIPVNDHRAELSNAQQEWPQKTLQNSYKSPLLAQAASIRGSIDLILYLLQESVLPAAKSLERLDTYLTIKYGKRYSKKLKLDD